MEEGFQNLNQIPPTQKEFASSARSSKKPNRLFLLLLFIGIVGLLLFLGKTFYSKNSSSPIIPTQTPVPTIESSDSFMPPTDVPSQVAETPTDSPTPTINPIDPVTKLDRSQISVAVKNGSGEVGAATKGSDILKSFGYHVVSVGNADNFDYQNVSIQVKTDKSQYLSLLQKDLLLSYTISSASADLSASSSADAIVVIGK